MKLQKTIAARKKVVEFNWCREWRKMDDKFRAIRSGSRNLFSSCFWCRHKFENGEIMFLAQPKTGRNKALCKGCAGELK